MGEARGTAIILAAGDSIRMGQCKALLPWLGETLLSYQIRQWLQVGVSPLIVLGLHNAVSAAAHSLDQQVVINAHPEWGKTSSILIGLRHLPESWDWVTIAAVDQPRPSWLYQRLISAFASQRALITVPSFQDRLGHPVMFRSDLLPELLQIREETLGLRQIMLTYAPEVLTMRCADPVVLTNLNTPEHYAEESERWSRLNLNSAKF